MASNQAIDSTEFLGTAFPARFSPSHPTPTQTLSYNTLWTIHLPKMLMRGSCFPTGQGENKHKTKTFAFIHSTNIQ